MCATTLLRRAFVNGLVRHAGHEKEPSTPATSVHGPLVTPCSARSGVRHVRRSSLPLHESRCTQRWPQLISFSFPFLRGATILLIRVGVNNRRQRACFDLGSILSATAGAPTRGPGGHFAAAQSRLYGETNQLKRRKLTAPNDRRPSYRCARTCKKIENSLLTVRHDPHCE
jgi:hypothetical protein